MPRKDEILSQMLSSKAPENTQHFFKPQPEITSTVFKSRCLSTHSARMPPPVRKSVCGTGWAAG